MDADARPRHERHAPGAGQGAGSGRYPFLRINTFIYAYPTKRYRSAWIGVAVHSASSVFLGIVILTLVA